MSWDANVCPYCGHDYRVAMAGPAPQKKESAMPVIGGILIIIGAIIELIVGVALAAGGTFFLGLSFGTSGVLIACGAILVIVAIIALLGGIFAIQRKNFGFAVVGGILSLGGWFIPGLIGLILVAISKDEFR
jgi:hypothetical protein